MINNPFIAILMQQGFFASIKKLEQFCEGDTSLPLQAQLELVKSKILAFKDALPSVQKQLEEAEKLLSDFYDSQDKKDAEINNSREEIEKLEEHIEILKRFEPHKITEINATLNECATLRRECLAKAIYHLNNDPKELSVKQKKVGTLMQVLHLIISAINFLVERREVIMKNIASELLDFASSMHIPDEIFFQPPVLDTASPPSPEYSPPHLQEPAPLQLIKDENPITKDANPTLSHPTMDSSQSVMHHPRPFLPNFRHFSPPPGFTLLHRISPVNLGLVANRKAQTP